MSAAAPLQLSAASPLPPTIDSLPDDLLSRVLELLPQQDR